MNTGTLTELAIAKAVSTTRAEAGVNVSKPLALALLNEAYHKIERASLWNFSEAEQRISLPSGQDQAAAPDDLGLVLMARNERTGRELLFHDDRQAFRYVGPDARNGDVDTYSIFAGSIRFYPAASRPTDVTLRYYKTWPDLVLDEDEPIFPVTWHDILTDYAAAQLILRLPPIGGRYLPASAAEPYREAWQSGLQRMIESPLTLVTGDIIPAHNLETSLLQGEGVDW